MSALDWRPSAPLTAAVTIALTDLARVYKPIAAALEPTEAGRLGFNDFAFAMRGAALDAIPLAAREWISSEKYPPKPSELGKCARDVTAQYFADAMPVPRTVAVELPPIDDGRRWDRIEDLGRYAHRKLGAWQGRVSVEAVWALLWETAPDDEARHAVRAGTLDREMFREAVAAVAGRRAEAVA